MAKTGKKRGWLIYVGTVGFASGIFGFFLSLFGEELGPSQVIYFDPILSIFGGRMSLVKDGFYYGYTFSMNLPMIMLLMVFIIGIFASLSARNSPKSIGLTLVLFLLSFAGLILSRYIFMAVNPSGTGSGLIFGIGFYVAAIGLGVGAFFTILELVLSIRFWHRRDQFR